MKFYTDQKKIEHGFFSRGPCLPSLIAIQTQFTSFAQKSQVSPALLWAFYNHIKGRTSCLPFGYSCRISSVSSISCIPIKIESGPTCLSQSYTTLVYNRRSAHSPTSDSTKHHTLCSHNTSTTQVFIERSVIHPEDSTWEVCTNIKAHYPNFDHKDKVSLKEQGLSCHTPMDSIVNLLEEVPVITCDWGSNHNNSCIIQQEVLFTNC